MNITPLLITLDVERDYGPQWNTPKTLSYRSIVDALPERLAPIFKRYGIRPTYYLSPEVLVDRPSMQVLLAQNEVELATHLHGEYLPPQATNLPWTSPSLRILDMQCEYGEELERAKLETLTNLFIQVVGKPPRSFRAGRFGLGPNTTELLYENGYFSDSSVTPHLCWQSPHDIYSPDYRDAMQAPSFVTTRSGNKIFEIPITILGPDELNRSQDPLWFRPSFTSAEDLVEIARKIIQFNCEMDGSPRALVMMFHSQELVAGASPYCANRADVALFLDRIERCLAACLQLGCVPMTAEELYVAHLENRSEPTFVLDPPDLQEDQLVHLDDRFFHASLDQHAVQDWFKYIHKDRASRLDVCVPFTWLSQQLETDAAILATGCGPGLNLHWLAEQGFTDLSGLDCDAKALTVGIELAQRMNRPMRLWKDDGLAPRVLPNRNYDAITALNWTSLVDSFELGAFLRVWKPHLTPGGRLILDCIDKAYNRHPNNKWLTWDWDKPESQRRPSEYRHRHSLAEVRCLAEAEGFVIEAVLTLDQEIPKKVYALRTLFPSEHSLNYESRQSAIAINTQDTDSRPSILLIVDSPDWAHDYKSNALCKHLSNEFHLYKRFHSKVKPLDLNEADLIVVFYWMQLAGNDEFLAALERNRSKLVLGICSHVELEGEDGQRGQALLREYGTALFAHNRLLLKTWQDVFSAPIYYTPNGVDTAFFRPAEKQRRPGPLRVGWAGSLENFGRELRGFDYIADACAGIDNVEFLPAIKEQRLRNRVEMLIWYQNLDVYVCASRCEGTPNPCLEAAACGLPIITTPVGNMPEFLEDGVQGFFVERNTQSIRAAIVKLAADPLLRSRMSAANLDRIQAWSWNHQAEHFRELFRDCLSLTPIKPTSPRSSAVELEENLKLLQTPVSLGRT